MFVDLVDLLTRKYQSVREGCKKMFRSRWLLGLVYFHRCHSMHLVRRPDSSIEVSWSARGTGRPLTVCAQWEYSTALLAAPWEYCRLLVLQTILQNVRKCFSFCFQTKSRSKTGKRYFKPQPLTMHKLTTYTKIVSLHFYFIFIYYRKRWKLLVSSPLHGTEHQREESTVTHWPQDQKDISDAFFCHPEVIQCL